MNLNSRTVISHLALLAVGLTFGIWLARRQPPTAPVIVTEPPVVAETPGQGRTVTVRKGPAVPAGSAAAKSGGAPADEEKLNVLRNNFTEELNKGEFRQALLILQELEKVAPTTRFYFESNGDYLLAQRDWEKLKSTSKKCVDAFPESRVCLRHLANAEIQIGSKEDQQTTVNACLAIEPNDPDCRHMSGIASMNAGDYSSAVTTYERLIQDNGSYGVRFSDDLLEMQLGLALDGAGRPEEAINHLENACRLNNEKACQKIEELSGGGIN